jgi:glycosyltransferase involved in cell wall biosynthesis
MEKMLNLGREEWIRMGKNGRAHVIKKFNVQNIAREYLNTLEKTDF